MVSMHSCLAICMLHLEMNASEHAPSGLKWQA